MVDPIGFKGSWMDSQQEQKQIEVLEGDYHKLLDDLDGERLFLNREIKLIKEIEHDLVRIHKQIKNLKDEFDKRGKLVSNINGISKTNPDKAAAMVKQLFHWDGMIVETYRKIEKELEKHSLQDLHKVYEKEKLSADKITHIKELVSTMKSALDAVGQNLSQYHANSYNYQSWEQNILQNKTS